MPIRGIRGATTVAADEPDLILQATRELLEEILAENDAMRPEDVASAIFTVTDDLVSTFPAQGARQSLQQFGEQPVVVPLEHALSEVSVRRFAQLDEVRSILRSNGRYVAEKYPFGTERSRCRWEALHLPFGLEAVDAARRIVTKDDAVGDIERQCAAGKTVRGPGEGHEKNITGKTHFASYYFKAIWSV